MCRGKLVKIMEPTREYTTPTTSLCFIAHLGVVAVVAVHLPLLFLFVVAATARFNGCIIFLFFCFLTYTMEQETLASPLLQPCFPLLAS